MLETMPGNIHVTDHGIMQQVALHRTHMCCCGSWLRVHTETVPGGWRYGTVNPLRLRYTRVIQFLQRPARFSNKLWRLQRRTNDQSFNQHYL